MPAPKGNRNAVGNKGGGRHSKCLPEHAELTERLMLLGITEAQLAKVLGVSMSSIHRWKSENVEFSDALKEGRERADARVASSLYHRAIGYDNYPPDVTACIFWLKTRHPTLWRDRATLEITGKDGGAIEVADARNRNEALLEAVASRTIGDDAEAPAPRRNGAMEH